MLPQVLGRVWLVLSTLLALVLSSALVAILVPLVDKPSKPLIDNSATVAPAPCTATVGPTRSTADELAAAALLASSCRW